MDLADDEADKEEEAASSRALSKCYCLRAVSCKWWRRQASSNNPRWAPNGTGKTAPTMTPIKQITFALGEPSLGPLASQRAPSVPSIALAEPGGTVADPSRGIS